MPGGALWAGSQWNHVWVSLKLLKNSFRTSGLQDSNPLPSIFDSQHRSFGWIHTNFGWLKWLHTKKTYIWVGISWRFQNKCFRVLSNLSIFPSLSRWEFFEIIPWYLKPWSWVQNNRSINKYCKILDRFFRYDSMNTSEFESISISL
jgi:hypothetical protein